MGKSYIPKYRLEIVSHNPFTGARKVDKASWHHKGRITEKVLEKYMIEYIESLKPGGVNYHISKALGYMPIPTEACIVNQYTEEVVVSWKAPAFMVI